MTRSLRVVVGKGRFGATLGGASPKFERSTAGEARYPRFKGLE